MGNSDLLPPRFWLLAQRSRASAASSTADFAARWLPPADFDKNWGLMMMGFVMSRQASSPQPLFSPMPSMPTPSPKVNTSEFEPSETEKQVRQAVIRLGGYIIGWKAAILAGLQGSQCYLASYLVSLLLVWVAERPWLTWSGE